MNPVVEIQKRAISGKVPVSGGRALVTFPQFSWDNLVFMASQLSGLPPIDYFGEAIGTDVVLGIEPRTIHLKIPILFAAMSFGSVSEPAKIALARASTHLGTATNRVINYVQVCNEEMKMIAGAQGFNHTQKLCRENLKALTLELAMALELPFFNITSWFGGALTCV